MATHRAVCVVAVTAAMMLFLTAQLMIFGAWEAGLPAVVVLEGPEGQQPGGGEWLFSRAVRGDFFQGIQFPCRWRWRDGAPLQQGRECCGYATLVTNNDEGYLVSTKVLARSLQMAGSRHPLVVMVTEDVTEETMLELGQCGNVIVRAVATIENPLLRQAQRAETPQQAEEMRQALQRYKHMYTKLRVWELVDFERIVFLDADMLVLHSIDELFENEAPFSAVADCCDYFNSGTMVLRPSLAVLQDMLGHVDSMESYDGGDQGFLNTYFRDQWCELPYRYNAQQPDFLENPLQWNIASMKVIHFERTKPWKYPLSRDPADPHYPIHSEWWRVHDDILSLQP